MCFRFAREGARSNPRETSTLWLGRALAVRPMRKRRASRILPGSSAGACLAARMGVATVVAYERPALFDARLARRNAGSAAVGSQRNQLQAVRPSAGRL